MDWSESPPARAVTRWIDPFDPLWPYPPFFRLPRHVFYTLCTLKTESQNVAAHFACIALCMYGSENMNGWNEKSNGFLRVLLCGAGSLYNDGQKKYGFSFQKKLFFAKSSVPALKRRVIDVGNLYLTLSAVCQLAHFSPLSSLKVDTWPSWKLIPNDLGGWDMTIMEPDSIYWVHNHIAGRYTPKWRQKYIQIGGRYTASEVS